MVALEPETSAVSSISDLYSRNLNKEDKVVDFGAIRTNGSILLRREGTDWVLRAMPRNGSFKLFINASKFSLPNHVICVGGAENAVKPVMRFRLVAIAS